MKTASGIRVLIVDDHALIRTATKMVLGTCKTFDVIGEAADGATGVKMAIRLQPHIVLMDINMEPMSGIQATRILLSKLPSVIVIGFSALPHPHEEQEMLDAGAKIVLHKNAGKQKICESLLACYEQYAYWP